MLVLYNNTKNLLVYNLTLTLHPKGYGTFYITQLTLINVVIKKVSWFTTYLQNIIF